MYLDFMIKKISGGAKHKFQWDKDNIEDVYCSFSPKNKNDKNIHIISKNNTTISKRKVTKIV